MNKPLYITTFNRPLFEATGSRMLKTFFEKNVEGDLLIMYEHDIRDEVKEVVDTSLDLDKGQSNFRLYLIDANENSWRHSIYTSNLSNIDVKYGGLREHWNGKNDGWNQDWWRWFNKVAAIRASLDYEYSWKVLLDCDTYFLNQLPMSQLDKWGGKHDICYLLGPYRQKRDIGIEAGFVLFNCNMNGDKLIKDFTNIFEGDFIKYPRWDDGHALRTFLEKHLDFLRRDLVPNHPIEPYCPVFKYSAIRGYLEHDKGFHKRIHKVV